MEKATTIGSRALSTLLFSLTSPVRLRVACVCVKERGLEKEAKMVQRLTYRKRHSYATKSNQHRVVKTPGMFLSGMIYTTSKTLGLNFLN